MFTLSALPVMTWTTAQSCDMLHTKLYGPAATSCTLLMWDLFFASLLPAGTVRSSARCTCPRLRVTYPRKTFPGAPQITALQSARRLELSMLLRMARVGRHVDDDAALKADGAGAAPNGPLTRRAASLMAAPRAEVIATPRGSASETAGREGLWLNPLFGEERAPSGPELRGVLISTGGPVPPAPRISIRIDPAAPQATRLSRKLTR